MANTILEKLQEKYPYVTTDARNIAEALGMINGTGGRGSGNIADVMNAYVNITFQPNGGTGDAFDVAYVKAGSGLEMPICPFTPPEGKTFDYWCASESGSVDESMQYRPGISNTLTIRAPRSFYAIWKDA